MKYIRLIGVFLVLAACVAIAGSALASKPASGKAPVSQTKDEQLSEQSAESESDNETSQAGEPVSGGHEDPAGQDVNHECTGNCQE